MLNLKILEKHYLNLFLHHQHHLILLRDHQEYLLNQLLLLRHRHQIRIHLGVLE
jgi:hypothetical protein